MWGINPLDGFWKMNKYTKWYHYFWAMPLMSIVVFFLIIIFYSAMLIDKIKSLRGKEDLMIVLLIDLLCIMAIYAVIAALWMFGEVIFYGQITPRRIDDIVAIILAISIFMNIKK
jgi:cytochrome bd-type quinol oxidase subunit 1